VVLRVSRRATFEALRTRAYRGRCGQVRVSFCPDGPSEPARVAYAVGHKIGPAVARNRLRRRLRAAVAETADHLAPGAYLVSGGADVAELDYAQLRCAVESAMRSAAEEAKG
jgi:ribonuclease P protein component